jgi:FkbM family methyltransferase
MNSKTMQKQLLCSTIELFKAGTRLFSNHTSNRILGKLSEELAPTLTVQTKLGEIKFFCPGNSPQHRVDNWFTYEPETIEWIDNFQNNETFWDIGANIGSYSLYGALKGIKTLSFEPSSGNYYLLNKNIEINRLDETISALCIAFNDVSKLDEFNMSSTELGSALHSFAENIDWHGKAYNPSFKQAAIGFSVDEFIAKFNPPFPNYMKIDVDGIESKIVKGSQKTLSDRRLKSMLIELDSSREDYCSSVVNFIEENGMSLKEGPIIRNPDKGPAFNYIFIRN